MGTAGRIYIVQERKAVEMAGVKLDQGPRAELYGRKLSRMIQLETVSCRDQQDRTKFLEFHKLLAELFPLVHQVCEKHVFDGSLLFKWPGKGTREPVLLMSHHDVVEAKGGWEHPPFSGDIDKEGRVWGRGSVDTKASLLCIFSAVEELIADGYEPDFDVYIASSCTEEWSGDGAPKTVGYLQEQKVRLRLLMDEGGMVVDHPIPMVQGTYAMIGIVEKGYGDIRFTARGKGGHASAPGKNTSLVRLGRFMAEVDRKSPFKAKYTPVVEEMFRRMAPDMDFGMRLLFSHPKLFRPLLERVLPAASPAAAAMLCTTLAFTMAKGSDGANVLPQEASVTANMRFIHHQPNRESIECVSRIAAKYDIETEVIYQDAPCPVVDFRGEEFRLVEDVVRTVYPGLQVCPYVMTGGTDARYYKDICDNCIRFAPLYINTQQYAGIHGINENIFQGALPMGVDFYKEIIKRS